MLSNEQLERGVEEIKRQMDCMLRETGYVPRFLQNNIRVLEAMMEDDELS